MKFASQYASCYAGKMQVENCRMLQVVMSVWSLAHACVIATAAPIPQNVTAAAQKIAAGASGNSQYAFSRRIKKHIGKQVSEALTLREPRHCGGSAAMSVRRLMRFPSACDLLRGRGDVLRDRSGCDNHACVGQDKRTRLMQKTLSIYQFSACILQRTSQK